MRFRDTWRFYDALGAIIAMVIIIQTTAHMPALQDRAPYHVMNSSWPREHGSRAGLWRSAFASRLRRFEFFCVCSCRSRVTRSSRLDRRGRPPCRLLARSGLVPVTPSATSTSTTTATTMTSPGFLFFSPQTPLWCQRE